MMSKEEEKSQEGRTEEEKSRPKSPTEVLLGGGQSVYDRYLRSRVESPLKHPKIPNKDLPRPPPELFVASAIYESGAMICAVLTEINFTLSAIRAGVSPPPKPPPQDGPRVVVPVPQIKMK